MAPRGAGALHPKNVPPRRSLPNEQVASQARVSSLTIPPAFSSLWLLPQLNLLDIGFDARFSLSSCFTLKGRCIIISIYLQSYVFFSPARLLLRSVYPKGFFFPPLTGLSLLSWEFGVLLPSLLAFLFLSSLSYQVSAPSPRAISFFSPRPGLWFLIFL